MGHPISLLQPNSGTTRRDAAPSTVITGWRGPDHRVDRQLSLALGARGALAMLVAALALLWSDVTLRGLAVLFAAYALIDGGARVASTLADEPDVEHPRWAYLLSGCAGLLAGLMALFLPHGSGLTLAVLIGAWAIVTGLLELTAGVMGLLEAAWPRRRQAGNWLLTIPGAISVGAGLVFLARPTVDAAMLAPVLGVYAVIAGIVLVAGAWAAAPPRSRWRECESSRGVMHTARQTDRREPAFRSGNPLRPGRTTDFVPARLAGTNPPHSKHRLEGD